MTLGLLGSITDRLCNFKQHSIWIARTCQYAILTNADLHAKHSTLTNQEQSHLKLVSNRKTMTSVISCPLTACLTVLTLCRSPCMPLSSIFAVSWASVSCGRRKGGCTHTLCTHFFLPRYLQWTKGSEYPNNKDTMYTQIRVVMKV